jgi:hypothetical protein
VTSDAQGPVDTPLCRRFRCGLAKKTQRFSVSATDAAGNVQSNVGGNRLVLKWQVPHGVTSELR